MKIVFLFSSSVQLKIIVSAFNNINKKYTNSIELFLVTTHMLLENERNFLNNNFEVTEIISFGEMLSDEENESIDLKTCDSAGLASICMDNMKKLKNEMIYSKLKERIGNHEGFLFSGDLGIDQQAWIKRGYIRLNQEKWDKRMKSTIRKFARERFYMFRPKQRLSVWIKQNITEQALKYIVYEKHKYIFVGDTKRIEGRIEGELQLSQAAYFQAIQGEYETREYATYIIPVHQIENFVIDADLNAVDFRWIQDGFFSPDYSFRLYNKYQKGVDYFALDRIGKTTLELEGCNVEILPFRKKMLLPDTKWNNNIKTILIAASCAGDWSAQHNRSDDDLLIVLAGELAKSFPNIQFIFRTHPYFSHDYHSGRNQKKRIVEYFDYIGVDNLIVSLNDKYDAKKAFEYIAEKVECGRSLEYDLECADLIISEFSNVNFEGAVQGIPFVTVNLTNRRDLFGIMSRMGFPHCITINQCKEVIKSYSNEEFRRKYDLSVKEFNNYICRE